MPDRTHVYCGPQATDRLIEYCERKRLTRFLLVADQNTYDALGRSVERRLHERAWDLRTVVLDGNDIAAGEQRVFEVLFHAHGQRRVYIAVGSGTITDITRYASFCARTTFISMPTAPSMDGYTSPGAALLMKGFKLTVPCHTPAAVFADLDTLCRAPRAMLASGFADMVGKYTALADWQLGALLLDEQYDARIARRAQRALQRCVDHAADIGHASVAGVSALMDALIESGFCMAAHGGSRPASGFEHLLSHFWEMILMEERRPPLFHGVKVGVGTVLAAQRYEAIRALSPSGVATLLSAAAWPRARDTEIGAMRAAYGAVAGEIIASHLPFLDDLRARRPQLAERTLRLWPRIQEIAAGVPPAAQIRTLLHTAGAAADPDEIGLSGDDVTRALASAHYLRNRLTVDTLGLLLGLW